MKKLILSLVLIVVLTACTSNTPQVFANDQFTITVPGNWQEDNVNDPSFVKGFFLESKAIAHVYKIGFEEAVNFEELSQESCEAILELWLTTFSYSTDAVEDQNTEYLKTEGNPDPFCRINYSLKPKGADNTNRLQFESLKVYFFDNSMLIGHFIHSGEGSTSTYSDAITDIADSFLLK